MEYETKGDKKAEKTRRQSRTRKGQKTKRSQTPGDEHRWQGEGARRQKIG